MPASTRPLKEWRTTVAMPTTNDAVDGATASANSTTNEAFLCSTDRALVQLDAINKAWESDEIYWAKPLEVDQLATMLDHSLNLAIYHCNDSNNASGTASGAKKYPGPMVGYSRLVTDHVTFAYLSDVYVLPAYQRCGLGTWMMRCMRELLGIDLDVGSTTSAAGAGADAHAPGEGVGVGADAAAEAPGHPWPDLRKMWLLTSSPSAARLYSATLNVEVVGRYRPTPGDPGSGNALMELTGLGSTGIVGGHGGQKAMPDKRIG